MKKLMFVAAALPMLACTPEIETTRIDAARGKQLFADNCAVCHGNDASGGGSASLGLGGPPPSLKNLSLRNNGVFPRDYVLSTIDGLSRQNHPTAAMPEFGAGDMGPTIIIEDGDLATPVPANMLALASYLESVQN